MIGEVPDTISAGADLVSPAVNNLVGGLGLGGWGSSSYIFSQMCENEKNHSSQYSSPSCSHCNYNPSDKGAKEKILKAYFTKFFGKHRVPYTTREASLTKIFNS